MTGAPTFIARSMILQILLGVGLGQRAAEDREVLAEDEDEPTVDRPVAGDDAVAEVATRRDRSCVRDERVELDERVRIEQQVEALARRQLAGRVLSLDAVRSPTESRRGAHLVEAAHPLCVVGHGIRSHHRRLCARTVVIIAAATAPPTRPTGAQDVWTDARISTNSVNKSPMLWITRLSVNDAEGVAWARLFPDSVGCGVPSTTDSR